MAIGMDLNSFSINKTTSREIVITQGGENVLGDKVHCYFDGEFSIKANSSFGPILESESNSLLTILSGATNGKFPSGQNAIAGAQSWDKTDPLSLDFEGHFYMNTSGLEDVVKPCLNLIKTCLPRKEGIASVKGFTLSTLVPPGPNIQAIVNASGDFEEAMENSEGMYNVAIGFMNIKNVFFVSVEPTFSAMVDSEGYPVKADVSFSISSISTATKQMMDDIYNITSSQNNNTN